MRRIHKIFLTGCGYAVLILSLFYAFAAISKFVSQSIAPGQFILIVSFGFIISLAEFMYEELKVKKVYKCLIHYGVLLAAFYLIFIISGKISAQKPSAVFVAIILYTILYCTVWAIVHFSRKAINYADDKLEAKSGNIRKTSNKTDNKGTYKPLYGDGDK